MTIDYSTIKKYLPELYQEILVEKKEFDELALCLTKENIKLNTKMLTFSNPEDLGNLLAKISLEKIKSRLVA